MLKDVELPFYPSATDCLVWSRDGDMAVAAGEHVYLLIAERRHTAQSTSVQDADPWAAVRFRVNSFTTAEWPMQEPDSFEDFSIGEELSLSTVTALRWSAPGLGKHRRSVLAVLTSNLVLSIWESKSDPRVQESWERALVINHSLRAYFSSHDDHTTTSDVRKGSLRQRTRIRAFVWAEPLRWEGTRGHPSYHSKWGIFLLAVTNENGEIVILRIVSPYSTELGKSGKWGSAVWWHGKAVPSADAESPPARPVQPSLVNAIMSGKRFIRELAWGSWIGANDRMAILTYRWGAQIYSLKVSFFCRPPRITVTLDFEGDFTMIPTRELVHNTIITPNECHVLTGCYKHVDDSELSTNITAIAARDTVKVYIVHIDKEMHVPNHYFHEHQLKTKADRWKAVDDKEEVTMTYPWDQITGLALCKELQREDFYFYITTHLSHLEVIKYMPYGEPTWSACVDTSLQSRMSDCRLRFDHGHDLGDLSVMKTWGLASAGGYIAACVSVHPGDMVEYTIQSEERSTIVFGEVDTRERRFPWEKGAEHDITEAEAQARILDTIFQGENGQDGKERSILDNKIIYAAACATMHLGDAVRLERLERAMKALQEFESATGFAFGPEIACIESLLMMDSDSDKQASEIRNMTQKITMDQYVNTPAASRIHETCSICGESIGWDSLDAASCIRGHAFVRCALTFLTIQEPGISKYCESCNREYLDEQELLDPTKHGEGRPKTTSQEPSVGVSEGESTGVQVEGPHGIRPGSPEKKDEGVSLARVLFGTYDVCIYCGGKFVG